MADRYELVECGLVGGEEGVGLREHVGSGESELGTENRTMVRSAGQISPLREILFCC